MNEVVDVHTACMYAPSALSNVPATMMKNTDEISVRCPSSELIHLVLTLRDTCGNGMENSLFVCCLRIRAMDTKNDFNHQSGYKWKIAYSVAV